MINDSLSISRDVPVVDLGRTLTVKLLKMGEEEGLTVAQAASLFGVTDAAIKNHVKNHRLNFDTFSVEQLKYLKLQGVLPLNTPTANFLPRETLRQLVRHIGTPAADAIYLARLLQFEAGSKPAIETGLTPTNPSVLKNLEIGVEGQKLLAQYCSLPEGAFFTVGQAAAFFGVTSQNVSLHISSMKLATTRLTYNQKAQLIQGNIISPNTHNVKFLDIDAMETLATHIRTPVAQAMLKQALQSLRDPAKYVSVQEARFTKPETGELDEASMAGHFFQLATLYKESVEKRKVADKRAFSAMGTAGALSKKLTAATVKIETLSTALEAERAANRPKYRVCGIEVMTDDVSEWGIDTCSKVTTAIVHWLATREKPKDATARTNITKQLWYAFRSNLQSYATNSNLNVDEWRIIVGNALRAYGKTRVVFEELL